MYVATLDFSAQVESPRFLLFPSTFCWSWFMIIIMHNMQLHYHYLHHLDHHLNDFESVFTKKNPPKLRDACIRQTCQANTSQVKWILEEWWKLPPYWVLYNQLLPPWWHRWASLAEGEYSGGCRCSLWRNILTLVPRDTSGIISIGNASTLHRQVETIFHRKSHRLISSWKHWFLYNHL